MRRFFLLINIFIGLSAYSQIPNMPTPNAASLAVFGQYPPSSFTGVPLISVPVYDFNFNGLSLPIRLNYNTNIVKPDINASWVGMGWDISAGGSINRVINDKPDDVNFYVPIFRNNTGEASVGYYYNHSFLSASNWGDKSRVKAAVEDILNYKHNRNMYTSMNFIKDYSTDEYSFSVADINGSFYLDDQGMWRVKSKTAIRVVVNEEDFAYAPVAPWPANGSIPATYFPDVRYLLKITLIDTRGIRYVFGGVEEAIETNAWPVRSVKAWQITSVIFPTGQSITYTYEKPGKVYTSMRTHHHVVNGYSVYANVTVTPVYLKRIQTDLHDINFFRSESPGEFAKLDSITVNDRLQNMRKHKYSFSYENTPMSSLKLRLKSVSEQNINNQVAAKHTFLYNSANFSGNNIDHWGYFNQKAIGTGNFNNFYNARETDTASCRTGLLTTIVYPTGGYTRYTWEPNSYSKQVPAIRSNPLIDHGINKYTGGVRIKQIVNFDQNNTKLGAKSYNYSKDVNPTSESGISSGVLSNTPTYNKLPPTNGFDDTYAYLPNLPLIENNTGSHITYSRVTEINADGSYNVADFSNFDNGINNEYMDESAVGNYTHPTTIAGIGDRYISNSHERGALLRERMYSNSSNLISDKTINYQRIDKETSFVRLYDLKMFPDASWDYDFLWQGSALKIYTNDYLPVNETNIRYDIYGLNPVTNVTEYEYTKKQIKSIFTTDSKGKRNKIQYRYAFDIANYSLGFPTPDVITHPFSRMIYDNQIGTAIETIETVIKDNTEYVISASATTYKGFKYAGNRDVVMPYKNFKAEMKSPKLLSSFTKLAAINTGAVEVNIVDGMMKPKIVFNNYDFKGNLLSVENGEQGIKTGSIWAYNYNYPIATIKNADNSQVSYADFEYVTDCFPSGIREWAVPPAAIAQMYGFFNPMEGYKSKISFFGPLITSKIVPQDDYLISFYAKGTGNIKINNVDKPISGDWQYYSYSLLNITNVILQNPNGLLIDNLMLHPKNALVTTYSHRPLTGIISQTDSKGLTVYYEYDSFQRLRNIKDHYGNIIKTYCYNYAGQLTDCNTYEAVPLNQ